MGRQPTGALVLAGDVVAALGLLTRVPVRPGPGAIERGAAAAWAWPLAGVAVALPAAALGWVAMALGLGPGLAAALALAAAVMLTGALHEDGLADCADGFWGGAHPARRLQIMKDSRIGAFGVLALVMVLLGRWAALAALFGAGHLLAPLLAAGLLSRAAMVGVMAVLPNARGDGLAHGVGRPAAATAALAAGLALFGAGLVLGSALPVMALAAVLAAAAVAALARARIGGQTGDVLGAVQQMAELAAMLAAVAILAPQGA